MNDKEDNYPKDLRSWKLAGGSYLDGNSQKIVDRLVERELVTCISSLMTSCFQNPEEAKTLFEVNEDDLLNLSILRRSEEEIVYEETAWRSIDDLHKWDFDFLFRLGSKLLENRENFEKDASSFKIMNPKHDPYYENKIDLLFQCNVKFKLIDFLEAEITPGEISFVEVKNSENNPLRISGLDPASNDIECESIEDLFYYLKSEGELGDIDDYSEDVLEHWVVSSFAYEKLEDFGEVVGEFGPFKVWGRTTSGQSIGLDRVWWEIAASMEILPGQQFEWKSYVV